jgi:hypothetical protein
MHHLRTLPYLLPGGTETISPWPVHDHRRRSRPLLRECRLRPARDRTNPADLGDRPATMGGAVAGLLIALGHGLERAGTALRAQGCRLAPRSPERTTTA